jgi:pimeloyl-ACP methyl ester carboxylesterase
MNMITSKDGTRIAYERLGTGPSLVIVDGAMCYRDHWGHRPLAQQLVNHFTVYIYDRRGRGTSDDTLPYAVEREIEDIAALIDAAGGTAFVYGMSSGAVLALKGAAQLGASAVSKLALYEPPFNTKDPEAIAEFARYSQQIDKLLKANKPGDAAAHFMADMMTPEELENMRSSPEWALVEAVAHTLAYDNAVMGDGSVPTAATKAITIPTLILDGEASMDFMHQAVNDLAGAIPHAQRRTLKGQAHGATPEVLAPVLTEFFLSDGSMR